MLNKLCFFLFVFVLCACSCQHTGTKFYVFGGFESPGSVSSQPSDNHVYAFDLSKLIGCFLPEPTFIFICVVFWCVVPTVSNAWSVVSCSGSIPPPLYSHVALSCTYRHLEVRPLQLSQICVLYFFAQMTIVIC